MAASPEERERLMWEEVKKPSTMRDELMSFAAKYPPMGVYIPKGRIKVPQRRLKRLSPPTQSSRGKIGSPHLLMIKPSPSNILPSIYAYVARHKGHHQTGTQLEEFHHKQDRSVNQCYYDNMNNGMIQCHQPLFQNNNANQHRTIRKIMPPPYTDMRMNSDVNTQRLIQPDVTSFVTQDIHYPLRRQYFQELSAIAAIALSDCNQATEKLRQIYEETANLSRNYDPYGCIPRVFPGLNCPMFAKTQLAPPPQQETFSTQYRPLTDVHYTPHMPVNQIVNQQTTTPSQSFLCKRSPELFYARPTQDPPLKYDVTNHYDISRENISTNLAPTPLKRKISDTDLFIPPAPVHHPVAKAPKLETPKAPFFPDYDSHCQSASGLASVDSGIADLGSTPYDNIGLSNTPLDIFGNIEPSSSRLMNKAASCGVARFQDKLCLPSVSFSPSQTGLSLPFIMH